MLIAATVVAGGPIYLRALEKIGIKDTVEQIGPYNKNITVNSSWVPLEANAANEATADVDAAAQRHIGPFIESSSKRVKSRSHFWNLEGLELLKGNLSSRAFFQVEEGIESEIVYVEGRHPSNEIEIVDGIRIVEASIHNSRVTRKHGNEEITLKVGDVIDAESELRGVGLVKVRITGIFREIDRTSQFWLGFPTAILEPSPPIEFGGRDLPLTLHVTWDTATIGVAPSNAGLPGEYNWIYFTDVEALNNSSTSDMLSRIKSLEDQAAKDIVRPNVITSIDPNFEILEKKILFVRIPMFLLAALTVVIVVYYLFLVSGLLAKRREGETVMLRSRGLSVAQVLKVEIFESALLIGIPVLIAPLLAALAIWQMGRLPVFETVTAGGVLSVELTWLAWAYSAATGVVAVLILLMPTLAAARKGVSDEKASESRPDRPPLFQRYYLDVLFLLLGGLIWYELDARGSVVSGSRDGGQTADVTLLFAPAIFLLVVALIFLRVFPLVAKLVSSVASKSGSASISVGFWRLGRRPYWYSWPIMLLVLAGGLGVLSGTLASTLERSSEEQVLYESGADIHVIPSGISEVVTQELEDEVKAVDGVNVATRAMRGSGVMGTTSSGPAFRTLSVEAIDFPKVGWIRDDFSDSDIRFLLEQINVQVKPEPLYFPEGVEEISIWAKQTPYVNDHFLWLILRDSAGRTTTVTLGQIADEWSQQSATVPTNLVGQIELISIQTFMQAGGDGGAPTNIFIDDLTAKGPGFEELVIDFETPGLWTGLPTSNGLDTEYSLAIEGAGIGNDGQMVASVKLERGTNGGVRGIYRTATSGALPVIVSENFISETNSVVGVPFVANIGGGFVPLVAVDTLRYFPTLDASQDPFIVTDIDSLLDFLELRGLREIGANELFASIDTTRHTEIRNEIRGLFRGGQIVDRQALLNDTTIDPLAVAGWRGMGVVALILTAIATVLGYITFLSAHNKSSRHDIAYMRAIGLSRGEFLRIVLIEHALIGAMGMALGIITGIGVSRAAVNSMAFTERGDRLLPPFILQTDWLPVGIVLAIAAFTAIVILAGVLRGYPRLPLHVLTRARG